MLTENTAKILEVHPAPDALGRIMGKVPQDERKRVFPPRNLPFLKGLLSETMNDSRNNFSPRYKTSEVDTHPFVSSEAGIFLDWYRNLRGSDQKNIQYFLTNLHTWATAERGIAEMDSKQLPYFMAGACGESVQHESYDVLPIIIATNKMTSPRVGTPAYSAKLSNEFLDALSLEFRVKSSEMSPRDCAEVNSGFERIQDQPNEAYGVHLTPKTGTGKPLHLIVANLDNTEGLNRHIIPQHATIYKIGNTSGYIHL